MIKKIPEISFKKKTRSIILYNWASIDKTVRQL